MIFIASIFPFCISSSEYWTYAWLEFSKSSSFSFLVNLSNHYRVSNTLCRAARPQTLGNLIFILMSKGKPLSLTSPTLITSVGHDVCDLVFRWWEAGFDCDPTDASSSWVCWPCSCWVRYWASSFSYWPCYYWVCYWASSVYCRLRCCCRCSDWDIL
jgi:hypothetical protein